MLELSQAVYDRLELEAIQARQRFLGAPRAREAYSAETRAKRARRESEMFDG